MKDKLWTHMEVATLLTHSAENADRKEMCKLFPGRTRASISLHIEQIFCLIGQKSGVKVGLDDIGKVTAEMFNLLYDTGNIHQSYYKIYATKAKNKIIKNKVGGQHGKY